MDIINGFISNQTRILKSEQEYCQAKFREDFGDERRSCLGEIIEKSVPQFGGTIVTFGLIHLQQNKETAFKLGTIIEVRKGVNLRSEHPHIFT